MTRLLRFSEVMAITGLSRSSLYRRLAADEFPEPIMVGPRSIRFNPNPPMDRDGRREHRGRG